MKKLFYTLILTSISIIGYSNENININPTKPTCRVSCSITLTNQFGETYTISSKGGWFMTGCDKAGNKCMKKLMHNMIDMIMPNSVVDVEKNEIDGLKEKISENFSKK